MLVVSLFPSFFLSNDRCSILVEVFGMGGLNIKQMSLGFRV